MASGSSRLRTSMATWVHERSRNARSWDAGSFQTMDKAIACVSPRESTSDKRACLLGARRNLDPRLGARGRRRIVRAGALAVVPERLRRRLLHEHGRWLHDHLLHRRPVPPRTPPGTPPERRPDYHDSVAVTMEAPAPAVESRSWEHRASGKRRMPAKCRGSRERRLPSEDGRPRKRGTAAPALEGESRRRRREKERQRRER